MADWRDIPNESIEPDAPARSIDAFALRDNPIAIAEGAPGAPRIDGAISPALRNGGVPNGELGAEKFKASNTERDWVLARTAGATAGVVGSYALMTNGSPSTFENNETIAGSNLTFASASGASSGSASGTWRCMGRATGEGGEPSTTVWLRIS